MVKIVYSVVLLGDGSALKGDVHTGMNFSVGLASMGKRMFVC